MKKNAAIEAVKNVKDGFVVGLGSGSTVAYVLAELGKRIKHEGLQISGVPTSYQTLMLAIKHGIPLTTLKEKAPLDLTIDGADQIDEKLNLLKGMGGALANEKIVASASETVIIVADESKKVRTLGDNNQKLPVEVLPLAMPVLMSKMKEIGGQPSVRIGVKKVGPLITDNGHFILDVDFGLIYRPAELDQQIKLFPGVVETGIFVNIADIVYLGTRSGVERLQT